jgi:hypothetical protein
MRLKSPDITREPGIIRTGAPRWLEATGEILSGTGLGLGQAAGLATTPVSGPLAPAVGLVTGGTGYALGKALSDLIANIAGYRKGAFSPYAPQEEPSALGQMKQTGKDILTGGQIIAESEIPFKAASGLVSKLQPYRRRLFEVGETGERVVKPEITEKLAAMEKYGIKPTPADIVPDNILISRFEKMLEHVPGGTETIYQRHLFNLRQLNAQRNRILESYGPQHKAEDIGRAIKQELQALKTEYEQAGYKKVSGAIDQLNDLYGLSTRHEAGSMFEVTKEKSYLQWKTKVNSLYENLYNQLPQKGEDIVPHSPETIEAAKAALKKELSIKPSEQKKDIIRKLQGFISGTEIPKELEGAPSLRLNPELLDTLKEEKATTWYGLDQTRSRLLADNRAIYRTTVGEGNEESRINSMLIDLIDKDQRAYLAKINPEMLPALDKARAARREMGEIFDKQLMKIANKSTEDILDSIVKKGEVSLLRTIRSGMGEEGLQPLRQGFLGRVIGEATKGEVVNPKIIQRYLKDPQWKETMDTLLLPEQRDMLQKIVDKSLFFKNKLDRKSGMKTIDFIDTLLRKSSDDVVNTIFKAGTEHNIAIAEKLLSPERMTEVKRLALEKVLKVSSKTGDYMPITASKFFSDYEVPLRRLLKGDTEGLREFINMGRDMSRVEQIAENTSRTAPSYIMARTFWDFFRHPVRTTGLLITENTLSRIYLNPEARKYMLRAWKLPATSEQAGASIAKAFDIVVTQDKEQRQKEKGQSAIQLNMP